MKYNFTYLLLLGVSFLMLYGCAGHSSQQNKAQVYGYPRAEYHKCGSILMHTPGIELFDGIIHPAAGLYERYFDIDKDLCTMCFNRYDAKDSTSIHYLMMDMYVRRRTE